VGSKAPVRTPDNLRSIDELEVVLALGEGPIQGLVNGDKSFYVGDTPLQNSDNSYNFELFSTTFFPGDNPATKLTPRLGGFSNSTSVGVNLFSGTAVVRQTSNGLFDYLEVRITVNQLYLSNDNGVFDSSVTFRIEYKPSNSSTWEKFFDQDLTISGKTTSVYAKEFKQKVRRLTVPYDIRVTKISPESDTTTFRDITWESFQEVDVEPRAFNDTALIQVSGKATDQLTSIPQFKGLYRGLLVKVPSNYNPLTRTYTGLWNGTFQVAWTNNPAWILYDFIMNDRYGINAYYSVTMDKYDCYVAAQWCDQLVDDGFGGTQPRYTLNMVVQEARNGKEMAQYIAGVFNAALVDNLDGSVGLRIDKDDPAVALFAPENVTDQGFQYSYTDLNTRYNDITVSFINPELDWAEDRRRVFDQANIDLNGRVALDFVAVGCTNAAEAIRRAQYKLLTSLTEKELLTFTTNRLGAFLKPWDVILVADPDMGYAVSGRIKSINAPRTILTLRDAVYLEVGVNYKIKVQYPDQIVERDVLPVSTGMASTLVIPTPLPTGIPSQAVFSLEDQAGGLNGLPKPYRVLSIVESDGNPDVYEVSCIEINRDKFDDADGLTDLVPPSYNKNPSIQVRPPTALAFTDVSYMASDGTYRPRLRVDWVAPTSVFVARYEVQYKLATDTAYETTLTVLDNVTYVVISTLEDRKDWDVRIRAVNQLGSFSEWVTASSTGDIPNDAPPGQCTGLTATGQLQAVALSWANPSDPDLKHIEVWENSTNNVLTASKVGEVTSTSFIRSGLATNVQKYYWVRAVDRSGNVGEFNSNLGTSAITIKITPADAVEDFIDASLVLPLITDAVNIHPLVISHSQAVLNLIDVVNNRFIQMKASQGDNNRAFVVIEDNISQVVTDLSAEVTQRTILGAVVADNTAAIATETSARVSADSAMASQITVVQANVSSNAAAISNETSARVSGDSALASQITTLTSTVGSNQASAQTQINTLTTNTNATASTVTGLSTTVGGHTTTISAHTASIDGITGQYFVKINNNTDKRVVGFGLASTLADGATTSEFVVMADKFAVAFPSAPGATPVVPFLIQNVSGTPTLFFGGQIRAESIATGLITGPMIGNNQIGTVHIANASITGAQIANATITGAQIANATLTGSNISGGTITNTNIQNSTITNVQVANNTLVTTNISIGAVSQNYYNTQAGPTTVTIAGIQVATIGGLGVPAGELGNYKLKIDANIEYEFDSDSDAVLTWRIANGLYALTPLTLLAAHTPEQTIDLSPDFGIITIPETTTPGKTSLSISYIPVSTLESYCEIQVFSTTNTGSRIKNGDLTITVFKR
jgi:predicted phage tail protein